MKGALLVILGSLVLASGAQAVTLVNADGTPVGGQWQRWADEMRVPSYQGVVTLSLVDQATAYGICSGNSGCTVLAQNPQIVLGPYNRDRASFYHELGHIYDFTTLTDTQRARFMVIWRIGPYSPAAWANWRSNSIAGTFAPREWFAEAYRICAGHTGHWARRPHGIQSRAGYGYPEWFERAACRIMRSGSLGGVSSG